jgi:hypothetical protein
MSTSKLHNLSDLSDVQKKLLKEALQAHYRKALAVAFGLEDPGCFGVKVMMRRIEDRKERARRRAAAGLSIARLIRRGLLASCSRGKWCLTRAGVVMARRLYPEIQPMSKQKVARTLEHMNVRTDALREAIHATRPGMGRRRKRPRVRVPQAPKEVPLAGEPGIEIPFDY